MKVLHGKSVNYVTYNGFGQVRIARYIGASSISCLSSLGINTSLRSMAGQSSSVYKTTIIGKELETLPACQEAVVGAPLYNTC